MEFAGRSTAWRVSGLVTALLCCACAAAPSLRAQATSISGQVLDDMTHSSVPGASVTLLTERGQTIARTFADSTGFFWLETRRGGFFRIRAERLGYAAATSPRFEVEARGAVQVEMRLKIDAVLLTPLEIVGRSSAAQNPMLSEFFYRKQRGLGHFITRDQIRDRNASHVADLLLTVPGIRLRAGRSGGGWMVYMSRAIAGADGSCPAQIFVDGLLMNRRIRRVRFSDEGVASGRSFGEDMDFTIDEIVTPGIIEGIEVYSGVSSVPAQFVNADSRCGVVLIWTRRGV